MKNLALILIVAILISNDIGSAQEEGSKKKPKKIVIVDMSNTEILVMVGGTPIPWVGTSADSAVLQAIPLSPAALAVEISKNEKAKLLIPILESYPLHKKIRDSVVSELAGSVKGKVTPVCFSDETPEANDCAVVNDVEQMKKEQAGKLLITISVYNIVGIHNHVPIVGMTFAMFETTKGKHVVSKIFLMGVKKEFRMPESMAPRKGEEWLNTTDDLYKCYDDQIGVLTKSMVSLMMTGQMNPNINHIPGMITLKGYLENGGKSWWTLGLLNYF